MRSPLLVLGVATLLPVILHAQQPSLQKLWETDTIIAVPESVLPDPAHDILYVSLIDGGPWDADGKGGVGRGRRRRIGWQRRPYCQRMDRPCLLCLPGRTDSAHVGSDKGKKEYRGHLV